MNLFSFSLENCFLVNYLTYLIMILYPHLKDWSVYKLYKEKTVLLKKSRGRIDFVCKEETIQPFFYRNFVN